jgi:hypothetical protein
MELPEDEDGKVRRNLVAFSAGVLLLAWLRIPTSAVFQKLGAQANWQPDPVRLWLAVSFVLFYLAVRFHFSGGGARAYKTLEETYQGVLEKRTGQLIVAEGSRDSPHSWWEPSLTDILASAEEGFKSQKTGEFPAGLERTLAVSIADAYGRRTPKKLEDEVKIEVTWVNRAMVPPTHVWTYASAARYRLPTVRRLLLRAQALWLSWFFSEAALALMAPVWLSLAASFLIGFRLGTLFMR